MFGVELRVQGVYDSGFHRFAKPFVKVKPRRQPTQLPTGSLGRNFVWLVFFCMCFEVQGF